MSSFYQQQDDLMMESVSRWTRLMCDCGWSSFTRVDRRATYWGVWVEAEAGGGAGGGGRERKRSRRRRRMVKVYLVRLSAPTRRPHKLHDGHEDGDDEAADQNHEDPTDVLHPETWDTHRDRDGEEKKCLHKHTAAVFFLLNIWLHPPSCRASWLRVTCTLRRVNT